MPDSLDAALEGLKTTLETLDPKCRQLITDWLAKWSDILKKEKSFDSSVIPYYKRGDIVYVDLGFNVGSELGGVHYAVVYENKNSKKSKNIVVVPLSHVEDENKISRADIYLGEGVIPWTPGVKTIAKPYQIRAVSKMRILKPLNPKHDRAKLSGAHLTAIDNRLKELLLKPEPVWNQ